MLHTERAPIQASATGLTRLRRCVCAGSWSRRPCSRSRRRRRAAAAASGRRCASRRRSPKGSADLPRIALEADGTAVAAWTENSSVRAATRLPGSAFGVPRAIASSHDAGGARRRRRRRHARARPAACPAGHGRHARRLVRDGRLGRRARAGGGDHGADHRGLGRAARGCQRPRRLRGRQLADDDLERCAHPRRRLVAGR